MKNFLLQKHIAIKNVNTGLFSTGGQRPHMKEYGKFWKKLCDVKSHISQICDGQYCDYYNNCFIVKFKLESDGTISTENIGKVDYVGNK